MAKIANIALTNTFNNWRTNSNISFDRLSQFAINNSRLYANTVVANNVLRATGNTVLGAATKRAIVTGLLSANGRVTVGTNLDVSGNTSTNKLTVTNSLTSSGNTSLGDGVADITTITGTVSVSKNLAVSGNTTSNKLTVTNLLTSSGNTALGAGVADITTITGTASISQNLTVSGNTTISGLIANGSVGTSNYVLKTNGATVFWGVDQPLTSNPTTTGLLAHTGRATISTNLAVSGNTSTNKLTVTNSLVSSGNTALGDAAADVTTITGTASVSKNLAVSGNTSTNKLTVTNLLTSSGNTALGDGVADITTITGTASVSKNLAVSGNTSSNKITVTSLFTSSGNTALGDGVADITTITGTASVSKNLAVSGNTSSNKITVTSLFTSSGNTTLTGALTYGAVTLTNSVTGTGKMVLDTSPVLVTPALGTPSSGVLSSCTVDGTDEVGFRNRPVNSQSANYTLVLADSGKCILHPSTDANPRIFTIPANSSVAYPVGTQISFLNMSADLVSIAITTNVLYFSPTGGTGTRSLAQYGFVTAVKFSSTEWVISGDGLT